MTLFKVQQAEWNAQASDTADLKSQVCRPVSDEDWLELVQDIKDKLLLTDNLNSILDVGCGNGLVLSEFSSFFDGIFGVDYGQSMIENAKDILPNGIFTLGEANQLLFKSAQFDRVISYSIFHYFPDENYIFQAIDEMIRVTKPGGIIFLGDLLDSNFEQKIKGASDLEYEKKLPYIQRYSQWTFCNLDKIKLHYQKRNFKVQILSQPQHFKLSNYRKDIRICL